MERVQFKKKRYKVRIGVNNVTIYDSYTIQSAEDMKDFLEHLRKRFPDSALSRMPLLDMICEWRAHNLLYSLNIKRDRTQHVDLNVGKPWYVTAGYFFLAPFYGHFI